jgi:hypothetical protein
MSINIQSDDEQLRNSNQQFEKVIHDLKLEVAFYKGEAKRFEFEKEILSYDVHRITCLFDELHSRQHHSMRNIADKTALFNAMVKYPCRSISDVLQLSESAMIVTSSQDPSFIEVLSVIYSYIC